MIIVNGMEMPRNCHYCRFKYDRLCHAIGQSFSEHPLENNGRLKDCPLIDVTVDIAKEGKNDEALPLSCNETRECSGDNS